MNEYKKKLDEMHAPEALIQATLNRIHEEEKMQSEAKDDAPVMQEVVQIKKSYRWIGGDSLAAAAALALVIGLGGMERSGMNLVYNTVSETIIRADDVDQEKEEMSIEDYSVYLGIEIQKLLENAELIRSEIFVAYDGEIIKEDEGSFYYNMAGNQVILKTSKTVNIVPTDLIAGDASEVDGQKILAGATANGTMRMAAFDKNGVTCLLTSRGMGQQEFEKILVEFLEK